MSVPFRTRLEPGGSAAYLRLVPERGGRRWRGALFQVDARGEPIEFTYSRVELPRSVLWRPRDVHRRAAATLAVALFEAARRTPLLLLCRADEIGPEVFGEMIEVQIPVCRVAPPGQVMEPEPGEEGQELPSEAGPVPLLWRPSTPGPAAPQGRLLESLNARGLLLEPFDRALAGLEEVLASAG